LILFGLIMSEIVVSTSPVALPEPRVPINIRPGTMDDIPFLDSLQKLHTKQVGWMPTATFAGKIKLGHVLVAEEPSPRPSPGVPGEGVRVGYLIGNDQYFKRDDVGIIYQLNVAPGKQRGFIGAALLKAQFERSAYGCKLYCCWCAQDIAANHFWEAMGFVPLAFRAGSETKGPKGSPRVHIFWQKRIRSGDETTPWWFPSKTAGGSIREDRIVLPIPPGTHWSDAKPLVLPGSESAKDSGLSAESRPKKRRQLKSAQSAALSPQHSLRRNGLMFDIPAPGEPLPETALARTPKPRAPRVKRACDPRLASAARELRDRWLETMNAQPSEGRGKYDVARMIERKSAIETELPRLLAA